MRELTVDSALANVDQVIDFVRSCIDDAGGSAKLQTQLGVVVDEVYSNIALYAYAPGQGPVSVQVAVEGDPRQAVIVFKDKGIPFNSLENADPDIDSPVEERNIGGLGIFMVKEIADEVTYAWEEGCNILTVKKYLQKIAPKGRS